MYNFAAKIGSNQQKTGNFEEPASFLNKFSSKNATYNQKTLFSSIYLTVTQVGG